MAEDWAADVKKYASEADDKAIAGIVRYCGIALQERETLLWSPFRTRTKSRGCAIIS